MKHLSYFVLASILCIPCMAQNWGSIVKKGLKATVQQLQTKQTQKAANQNQAATETTAQSQTEQSAPVATDDVITISVNGVSFEMVKVEAGTFTMGATPEMEAPVNEFYDAERPVHQVTLTKDYYMGKTEVTQALWTAVMGNNPSGNKGDRKPVDQVSWNDCQTFIKKLNAATGKNFRLPTDAEWEFAARGGNRTRQYKYSGNNTIDLVAWYGDNSGHVTHDVAAKMPNELGIYDMCGNVSEWCYDGLDEYTDSPQTDPIGAWSGSERAYRGSSCTWSANSCRISFRDCLPSTARGEAHGLRLAITADSAPSAKQTASKARGANELSYSNGVLTVKGIRYEMAKVEPGTFTMGAMAGDADAYGEEKPAHKVTLTKGYYIGKTEVTQALWTAVMGDNPSFNTGNNLPVDQVSWNDCQKFLSKLNAVTGKKFRLPTEAEWEFAARGGNSSKHFMYSGSNNIDGVAWYEENSNSTTHDVATKQPNELGIYDMTGNVWEWCQDWDGYYSSNAQTNPTGPASGEYRVHRGGGYSFPGSGCRISTRLSSIPDEGLAYIGLRLVLSE